MPGGLGSRLDQIIAWLDANCGSNGWTSTASSADAPPMTRKGSRAVSKPLPSPSADLRCKSGSQSHPKVWDWVRSTDFTQNPGLYLIDIKTGFETAIAGLPFGLSSGLELVNARKR
jgi:hypothetical protein